MEPGIVLPASPEPIRKSSYSQEKANLAMSNIISVPLNKLTQSFAHQVDFIGVRTRRRVAQIGKKNIDK
jgi:hypothetical protein